MKTSIPAVTAMMAAVPIVIADFRIYRSYTPGNDEIDKMNGFSVFEDEAVCEHDDGESGAEQVPGFKLKSDVSGDKTGFRCAEEDGHDNCNDPSYITELEMNFGDNWHYTIYRDIDFQMIGLDGNTYGQCEVVEGHTFNCAIQGEDSAPIDGAHFFYCTTDVVDAATLNGIDN